MWEWTTETGKRPDTNNGSSDVTCNENDCTDPSGAPNAVLRGGSFNNVGAAFPVVYASGFLAVGGCDVHIGFRVVLYLQ